MIAAAKVNDLAVLASFTSMQRLWEQGGYVLAVILACSVLGWALAVWKWSTLRAEAAAGPVLAQQVIDHTRRGALTEARALCQQHFGLDARLLGAALQTDEPQRRWFERHLHPLLDAEREALRRHLNVIATVSALLPLLGLLGTVLGMQQTFAALMQGGAVEAERLADGISKALITTQVGLVAALPLLLLHGYLRSRIERVLETATLHVKKIETLRCRD